MNPELITCNVTNRTQVKYLLIADSNRHINLRFTHRRPDSSSDISILIIASGNTSVKLDATVVIPPNTPNAKTNLDIKVISSGQAVVTAAPNLEINNNLVQASHSLFTVRLTNDELYYLASRGIDGAKAKQLLIDSYLNQFSNAIRL